MTDSAANDDDELLRRLKETVDEYAGASDSMVGMIMAGYDITNVESQIADLVDDVAIDGLVGVRSGGEQPRLITCSSEALTFEFEVRSESPQVVGHLDPPRDGAIHIDQARHSEGKELGELADFEFSLPSTSPFRLRFEPVSGRSIVTEWILP